MEGKVQQYTYYVLISQFAYHKCELVKQRSRMVSSNDCLMLYRKSEEVVLRYIVKD